MLYCLFRHMASQVLRDVVVRAGERALVRQLSSRALSSTLAIAGTHGRAAPRRHVREPLGAARRRRGRRRLRVLGHAAGRDARRAVLATTPPPRAGDSAGGHATPRRLTMCGRYELHSHPAAIALAFGLASPPDVHARYNIAPMTEVPIVRVNADGQRELVRMRWGLVPRWAKDPSIGARMINARGETIADKPSFRMSYRRHRCLLPADGFYEWRAAPARPARARPRASSRSTSGWRTARSSASPGSTSAGAARTGDVLDTCTIVTTAANALLAPIHDRMPLIVAPEHYARWLDPANADVADLIAPFPAAAMAYYPVSRGSTTCATTTRRCSSGSRRWPPKAAADPSRRRLRRSRNRCSDAPARRAGPRACADVASAPSIRRVAVRRDEQRHVVMRAGIRHAEIERHFVDERRPRQRAPFAAK